MKRLISLTLLYMLQIGQLFKAMINTFVKHFIRLGKVARELAFIQPLDAIQKAPRSLRKSRLRAVRWEYKLSRWLFGHRIAPRVSGKQPRVVDPMIREKRNVPVSHFGRTSFTDVFRNISEIAACLSRILGSKNETKHKRIGSTPISNRACRILEFRAKKNGWFITRRVNWKHLQFHYFPHCGFAIDPSTSINMPGYTISRLREVYYPGTMEKLRREKLPAF